MIVVYSLQDWDCAGAGGIAVGEIPSENLPPICYYADGLKRRICSSVCGFWLLLSVVSAWGQRSEPAPAIAKDFAAIPARVAPPCIVIGFVGGFVAHNNLHHSEVQLAEDLRKQYPWGVYVQTFENHHGEKAYKQILRLLDANHDGKLSAPEKQSARIIFYGHSWGGSEAVHLARILGAQGIPVLLTVQVDSVAKRGQNDGVIPANVAQAANFYQPHGLVRGRAKIRAADPSRTRIVGNFRFDYAKEPIRCEQYPWWDRFLVRAHTEIECDPRVWNRVEELIRSQLPPLNSEVSAFPPD